VRVDKMQIAALEAVLAMHASGREDELPVRRMLLQPLDDLSKRAHRLAESLDGDLEGAHVRKCQSVVGGGSMPGTTMPSWGVAVKTADPAAFAARLRAGVPSVFCRVEPDATLFDVRTVLPDQLPDLTRAIQYALEGDDVDED
jgi:L-seryl-tRNA(Ser) seleniumtransferase